MFEITTTPLRIAIIGCGTISHEPDPHAKLALVHDLDQTQGSRFAQRYGAEWTERLDDVLARQDIDAVIVSTPTDTRHDTVLAAAVAGKHILVEKPAALTLPALDAIQRASDNAGVVLMVGHVLWFAPMITVVHDSIAAASSVSRSCSTGSRTPPVPGRRDGAPGKPIRPNPAAWYSI